MNKDLHCRMPEEIYAQIKILAKNNKCTVNDQLNKIIQNGLVSDDLTYLIKDILRIINKIDKRIYFLKELQEQIYSDLTLPQTDYKNNDKINKFYNKLRINKFNE